MGRKRLLDYDQIKHLCSEGRNTDEIGVLLGCSGRAVREILRAAGLRTEKRHQELDHDHIIRLYQSGVSGQAIADQLGCSKAGIWHVLRLHEVPTRAGNKRHDTINRLGFTPTKEWAEGLLEEHGTVTNAAKACGLPYHTFYDYLRRFDIPREIWHGGPGGNTRRQDIPIEEAIELSEQGVRYADIATRFGVSYFVLSKRLLEAGYKAPIGRQRKWPEDEPWASAPYQHRNILRQINIRQCEVCGEGRALDLCHIRPRRKYGLTEADNSLVLCALHHRCYDKGTLTDEEYSRIESKVQRAVQLYGDWR